MNVLLIFPSAPQVFFNLTHTLDVLGKKALLPPVGLLTVAAMLPEAWGKRFVDLTVRDLTGDDLAWADLGFVTLTAANVQDASALYAVEVCKAAGIRVVAGGPGFLPNETTRPQQMELYSSVDHFVFNEAEITLPMLLEDLKEGTPQKVYETDEWADITQSPVPMWELLDFDDYMEMGVQLSRGCPYHCEFCVIPALAGRPGRFKMTAQFLRELDHLYELGWRGFVEINDDNLIGDIKFAKNELLPALAQWQEDRDRPFMFHTCVDVRVGTDDELLAQLREAGFHSVFLGIENLNEDCLAEAHKVANIGKDIDAIVERVQRAGILVYCGLMVGFDSDKPAVFQQVMDFVDRTGIIMPSLTKVNAVPGSNLYARLLEEGRVDCEVLPGLAYASNIRGLPMGEQVLDEGYVRVMKHLWDPEAFYARIKTTLEMLPEPIHPQKPTAASLRILGRIVLHVGVLGKERKHFWKLLMWTLTHRPNQLATFLSAPALGYGFRRRCEETFGADYRTPIAAEPAPPRPDPPPALAQSL